MRLNATRRNTPVGMNLPSLLDEAALTAGGRHCPHGPPIISIRIVKAPDGLPIRTMGMARTVGSGQYVSVRSGAVHPWEGETEHLLAQHDEVVTRYLRSIAQPFRAEAVTSERIERHVVDWARQRCDGVWEVINAKRDWSRFRQADARRQSEIARMAADALGAEYHEVVHATFVPTMFTNNMHERCNIAFIQSRRFTTVGTREIAITTDLLAKARQVELGRLEEALAASPAHGRAIACALMVRRVVSIDLARPLSSSSVVSLVPALPAGMPGLFELIDAPVPAAA